MTSSIELKDEEDKEEERQDNSVKGDHKIITILKALLTCIY